MSDQPVIDYTSRDFAGFRESLLAYAAERMPEWRGARTGDPNDFGVLLVELLAYEGDVLSYYTDRLANEAFLQTATQRQSVLNHAAMLDYTPQSATAATALLAVTVTTTTTAVTIPAGFQVSTQPTDEGGSTTRGPGTGAGPDFSIESGPVTFETTTPLTFPASTLRDPAGNVIGQRQTLFVTVVEGETVEDETVGVLCGGPNETFTLAQAPVIADSVVVRVVEGPNDPGTVWFRVATLLDAGPNDNAYTLSLDANDAVTIEVGDGVNGRIAPRGSVLHARYRVGGGSVGNVDAGDIIEVIDPDNVVHHPPGTEPGGGGTGPGGGGGGGTDPSSGGGGGGTDTDGDGVPDDVAPVEVEVVNPDPARGGTDSESLDSIRANAPRARRTNGRAVSLQDYETLAMTVPGVQIAKAKAVAKVYTNVTLYVAPPGGAQPDTRMLNAVVDYLLPRKMAGVTVVAATPTYVPVDVDMHVIVDSRFNQATVRTAVGNALQKLLDFEAVSFGGRVSLSAIYAAAIKVQGVTNVVISRLARSGDPAGAADVLLADNELPLQGRFSLTAEGGVVNSGEAAGASASPSASTAPAIQLLRCDPSSTHVELTWVAGDSTTHWEVEVEYRTVQGVLASRTVTGPFAFPEARFDLPRIGAGRAANITFRTRAFNGNTGPVLSPLTTTPYTCE